MPKLKLESSVIKYLRTSAIKALGDVEIFKLHSGLFTGGKGLPDLLLLWNGKTLFLEAKTKTGKLSDNQAATHTSIRKVGAAAWITKPVKYPIYEFKAELPGRTWKVLQLDITKKATWEILFNGAN